MISASSGALLSHMVRPTYLLRSAEHHGLRWTWLLVAATAMATVLATAPHVVHAIDGSVPMATNDIRKMYISPSTFVPSEPFAFFFEGSPVNITNATTEAEACGFICPGRVDGELIDGVRMLLNVSTPSSIRMTAICWLVVSNTTSETQVCTAFIRYNASYVENGTVYALPVNRTVTLDPRTRVIARGYTFVLWLWIELSVCPWYYDNMLLYLWQPFWWELSPRGVRDSNANMSFSVALRPKPLQCDVLPHPATGTMRARIAVPVPFDRVDGEWHSLNRVAPNAGSDADRNPSNIVMLHELHLNVASRFSAFADNVSDEIAVLDLMNVSMSSWQPMENYSEAPLATQPRRCYSTQPRATDGSPSTVWADRTGCSVYPGFVVRLDIEILNATTLCCSVPNATSPVVWSSPIEVWVNGARWFFDNAGIAGDPSPTAVPDSGKAPPRGYTNSSAPAAQPDAATDAPVGGSVGSSAGDGESAAIVIGAVLAAVCAVIAVGAVLYTAVWKRYRAAQSTKEQREDALREVMNGHGEDASFGAAATAPGTLEAELLGEYHRDHVDL